MPESWDTPLQLLPGPVMVPAETLRAMAAQVVGHRSQKYFDLLERVTANLRKVVGVEDEAAEVAVFPASGTGMLEAAAAHAIAPGDRILSCVAGAFGRRFAEIAERFGAQIDRIPVPVGQSPKPEDVAFALSRSDRNYKALLLTHCETSAGSLANLAALGAAAREASPDTLILVDSVSALGGTPMQMEKWGIDIVASSSQKALAAPPGLGILACSGRALERAAVNTNPRFYWDMLAYRKRRSGGGPYTPAVNLMFALDVALQRIIHEGLEEVYAHHARLRDHLRSQVKKLGMDLLVADEFASPTITVVIPPKETTADTIIKRLRAEHDIYIVGGMDELAGKVFRVGHMGAVTIAHLDRLLAALSTIVG